jgi:CBS domain-containing protein
MEDQFGSAAAGTERHRRDPIDTRQGCPNLKVEGFAWFGPKSERSPMKAQDIMTRDVTTVRPDTSVRDIAGLMVEKHISGVPVLTEDGKIIGIVSQSDLMHRAEVGTERKHKWWFRIFADSNALAREYAKAHGLKAHDIMSRYVVSVRDDAELRDVADILDNHRIKRVPVVQEGRLVGIITRGDLVRALSQVQITKAVKKLDNAALHKTLHDRIRVEWIDPSYISITVNEGVVQLWGFVETVDQRNALRVLIEETDGVTRVDDRLSVGIPFRGAI